MVALELAEPDVALTDLLIAVECTVFVALLRRRTTSALGSCFLGVFSCIGVASLLGGLAHGFAAPDTVGHDLLWSGTLVALAAMASLVWVAGSHLLLTEARRRWALLFAAAVFGAASTVIFFVEASFWVVVATYFPSVVWLAAGYVAEMCRRGIRVPLLCGFVGLLLTLVAAGIQQARVALHPLYFDHNALYHVVQALALLFVFASTRSLLPMRDGSDSME